MISATSRAPLEGDVQRARIGSLSDLWRGLVPLLDDPPEHPSADLDLLALGIDSIRIMTFSNQLRAQGIDVPFGALLERPTLAAWWELVRAELGTPESAATRLEQVAVDESAPFALTPLQHAYWVGRQDGQMLGGVGCHFYCEYDGHDVDPGRLARAVEKVTARHGMLRARFNADGTQQIMRRAGRAGVVFHDLRDQPAARQIDSLLAVRESLSHRRLRVEAGEVFDVHLSAFAGGKTRLHVSVDLLAADLLSIQIVLRELSFYYDNPRAELGSLSHSFPRYLESERLLDEPARARAEAYWRERLSQFPAGPQLPLAIDPGDVTRPKFERRSAALSPMRWGAFMDRAREHGVTPAMGLTALFAEVLSAWSSEPRFVLNMPVFARRELHPDVGSLVADFTRLILLAVDLGETCSFAERARRIQAQFRADMAHGEYSGVEVLRDLMRQRGGEPVAAPVVFACNIGGGDLVEHDFQKRLGTPGWGISQTPQVWLDHQVFESEGGLFYNWDVVEELFCPGVLDAMFSTYAHALERLCEQSWQNPLGELLPSAQRAVRAARNETRRVEAGVALHSGFFARAEVAPDAVALCWGEHHQQTYGQLSLRARQVAAMLQRAGARMGDSIAITLPKGPEQIEAVLAVSALGCAYVPVGVDQPAARRDRVYALAGVKWVLTNAAHSGATSWPSDLHILALESVGTCAPLDTPTYVNPDSTAYVIFTSGSTGEPKGVEVTHRAAVNTLADINRRWSISRADRVLAVSALDFDLSVYDVFGVLAAGGALVLISEDERRDARRWLELVERHGVTLWNSVPALLEMLLAACVGQRPATTLRLALASGDWVPLDLAQRLRSHWPECRLVALGGATEAAVWSNAFEVDQVAPSWRSIPYGFPLANQFYRVVDGKGHDCPDWVPGELWIGGLGVAQGYRGNASATERAFVTHAGQRWYRTGDLGRYWPDGTLEFMGRRDFQVKIRGHRIELGEIEATLDAHPAVLRTVCIASPDRTRLAAFVVPRETAPQRAGAMDGLADELTVWLSARLPAHMVPQTFERVDRLPLTTNGKVDRTALTRALPAQPAEHPHEEAPRRGLEQTVARLWSELLGDVQVARSQSFFALGGDSLIATRLMVRLRAEGIAGAELRNLFSQPVLSAFVATVSRGGEAVPAVELTHDAEGQHEPFPPTEVQRAYWAGRSDAFALGGIGCHFYLELEGTQVDVPRLERALQHLVQRHDMLRAIFDDDGQQRVLASVPPLTIACASVAGDASEALAELREELSRRTFDPSVWPLFEVRALVHGPGSVRLAMAFDNLVVDALSVMVLLSEWGELYDAPSTQLPPLRICFRDYVRGVTPDPAAIAKGRAYWTERLADLPPPPQLPLAKDPTLVRRPSFSRRSGFLPEARWAALVERARREQLTPSALLLTCYVQVLSAFSARPDLTVNLTLFDRRDVHPDINRVLGDFTSLLLVSHHPRAGESWLDAARRVQRALAEGLDHGEVSALWVMRELARTRGGEVAMPVVFTSALGVSRELSDPLSLPCAERVWGMSQTPQVWLDHQVFEAQGGLFFNWDAVDELFCPGVLDAMFAAYERLLAGLSGRAWDEPLGGLLPESQREVRARVNATCAPRSGLTLHHAFFAQGDVAPERVALLCDNDMQTHGELSCRARQVAALLRAAGARAGDLVAVTLPKSPAQIAAVLAVLYLGCAYVPVGVDQPAARRERIYEKAAVRFVVTRAEAAGGSPSSLRAFLDVDDAWDLLPLTESEDVSCDSLAYVIFTSGSTGEPKGVAITHRAAVNTVVDINRRFGVHARDRVLAISALDFDLSVYDVFGLLSVGGSLVLIDEAERRDAERWLELVEKHEVTLWNTVPALLEMLLVVAKGRREVGALRLSLVSGDWVGLDLKRRLADSWPECRMVALGGATEGAIWSNFFQVEQVPAEWRSIPYGHPLANQRYRVVDALGQDCPDWVVGELWIGGLGVAQGYRGDPEATRKSFVEHEGERWYRTGDLGRYWPDGTLEFLGRRDFQVKVRGHRIELGEIESALESHPSVRGAVACVLGEGASRRLAGAVVLRQSAGTPANGERPLDLASMAGAGGLFPDLLDPDSLAERHVVAKVLTTVLSELSPSGEGALATRVSEAAISELQRPLVRLWTEWLAAERARTARPHTANLVAGDPAPTRASLSALEQGSSEHAALLVGIARGTGEPLAVLEHPVLSPEALLADDPQTSAHIAHVASYLRTRAKELGRPLQVAELGARSGFTAERLLRALDHAEVRYTLLDASQALLERARARLAGLQHAPSFVMTPESVLPDALFERFDIVVANNALHRFARVADGLSLVCFILAERGELLAIESTALSPLALVSAAVLERGYPDLGRGKKPLLAEAEWLAALDGQGFEVSRDTLVQSSRSLLLRALRPAGGPSLSNEELREFLAARLPAAMIPERVVRLLSLPLSANGKVDRVAVSALLERQAGGEGEAYEPPEGPLEALLAQVWKDLLGAPRVGRRQSFFALGGDSLVATRLVEQMRRRLSVPVTLRQLFAAPTVADLAQVLAGHGSGVDPLAVEEDVL